MPVRMRPDAVGVSVHRPDSNQIVAAGASVGSSTCGSKVFTAQSRSQSRLTSLGTAPYHDLRGIAPLFAAAHGHNSIHFDDPTDNQGRILGRSRLDSHCPAKRLALRG